MPKGVRKFAIGRFYVKLHRLGNMGVSQGLTLAGRPQGPSLWIAHNTAEISRQNVFA